MKRFRCPQCEAVIEAESKEDAVCESCGYEHARDHMKMQQTDDDVEPKPRKEKPAPVKTSGKSVSLGSVLLVVQWLFALGAAALLLVGAGDAIPHDKDVQIDFQGRQVDTTCGAINFNHEDCKYKKHNALFLTLGSSAGLFATLLALNRRSD